MTDTPLDQTVPPGTPIRVEVRPRIPERFARLGELANDLYYSWNRGVRGLFRHLDEECWDACAHNPRVFIRRVRQHKLDEAARDPILVAEYRNVLAAYDTYHEERPTTRIDDYLACEDDLVAYFSAEFGFHESMPIYAGGLGILAADYCKAMSNLWVPFVGVGLLYRQGYFTQHIDCNGRQMAVYNSRDPIDLPVQAAVDADGNEVHVRVDLDGREIELKVWQVKAGAIRLFLLDSDVSGNSPQDRAITAQLYGGDHSMRLRQEIVLGIAGVRALRALGLKPTVWHINEGHAALLILERCRELTRAGMAFDTALELVAANTVFTTHTPVAAGHDVYGAGDMQHHFGALLADLGIDHERLMQLGAETAAAERFSMTSLALRGSRYHNGVSRIHGRVASEHSAYIWPQIPAAENPMRYITNGADVDTFLALPWVALFEMNQGGGWRAKLKDAEFWRQFIDAIADHVFWSVRQVLKATMLREVRRRALLQFGRCAETRAMSAHLTRFLSERHKDVLTIGFARRFATYKRATLLFKDIERLSRLVNDPDRPLLLIFAGKAHPNDAPGQRLLQQLFEISMRPDFQGRLILLEDYNLSMTRELLPGVDVWLNNPEYPMEACGTSGMKAGINGVINLSVLDGWWDEAYNGENGWAINHYEELEHDARERQEATDLLNILEYEVIPTYYQRNGNGEPAAWIRMSKASLKTILPQYNTLRMACDYLNDLYGPAAKGGRALAANDAAGAIELGRWKQHIQARWPGVGVRLVSPLPTTVGDGQPFTIEIEVDTNGLLVDDLRAECLILNASPTAANPLHHAAAFVQIEQTADGTLRMRCNPFESGGWCSASGLHEFRVRLYPYHALLSHPFECGRMLWL